ncbi:hypothetical protein K7432_007649 [Basidiobolus ranarum]|uniref:Uncharacterized protein n=1 Tax=Basidiobolus ranarum TaxID=34480 RepID=A0ABR2WT66_9FUNG
MGKWSQKSYDDELLRKVKLLFTELNEKTTKDSTDLVISYETFVDSLDENNSFVKQIFEFLIKDTAHKYRKRTQPFTEYTNRHRPSLSSIFQPQLDTQTPFSTSESVSPSTNSLDAPQFSDVSTRPSLERLFSRDNDLPFVERRLSRDINGTLFLERRLSRDMSAYLSSSLARPTVHASGNHFSVANFPSVPTLARQLNPSSLHAQHSSNPTNGSFHPYMIRRRSIPLDFERGPNPPPRERPTLRRMSFLGNLRGTALQSQGLERLNENDGSSRAQVTHIPVQPSTPITTTTTTPDSILQSTTSVGGECLGTGIFCLD